jgi:hypothetical protein
MAKVVSLANTKRAAFIKLALSSLQTKDLQVYLGTASQPSAGEALLQKFNDASTIEAPTTGDSLFVVDANVTGNKQNEFISPTATDNISIEEGNVTHHLTLTYNWPYSLDSSNNIYGGTNAFVYVDHIRVYVPPKALLAAQYGAWFNIQPPETGNSYDFGREVFSGGLTMNYQSQMSISLTWTVPGAAVKTGQTWKYQLLYQHQAGTFWTQTTTITLPSCAKVTSLTKLKAGPNKTYTVTGSLKTDTTYAVEYTCAG